MLRPLNYNPRVADIVNALHEYGQRQESRLGPTFEILGGQVDFHLSHTPYRPGMARKLGVVEALQVLSAYFDERHIKRAAPSLRYPYGLTHAYGIKVAQQLPKVVEQLQKNNETRRAIVHIGKPEDGQETEKPCIQSYQFHIRNAKLNMTIVARSWDVVSGLPYDVTTANIIGQVVARQISPAMGYGVSTFFAGSMHYYTEVWKHLVDAYGTGLEKRPPFQRIWVRQQFANWDEVREWAIDSLNDMDNWKYGLPEGMEAS